MATTISRWGNSLGVRLPKEALEQMNLREGDTVSIEATENGLLLKTAHHSSLEDLVAAITPQNIHAETPTGAIVGNEIW